MHNFALPERAQIAGNVLASLEAELSALIELRDPNTAVIVYELQKAIDRIRAEFAGQTSGDSNFRFPPNPALGGFFSRDS